MKIAHLITGLGLGGAEQQLKALVTDPEKSSLEHVVISLKDEGIIGKQIVGQPGVYLYCLNLHKSITGFWQLYKILRREKPDVLQTWLYHADFLGLLIGRLARVPRIIWNIRCSNMDLSQYSKQTGLIVMILKFLSRFPDAIVTNSQAGKKFHKIMGYRPRRWAHIPNGIDTDIYYPNRSGSQKFRQSLNIPENALVIGMLSRVDPMKDHSTFLKAMKILSQKHENLYCILAGKGTKTATWPVIPPRLLRLGIWKNVPEFLNSLDILVLSSAFGEGFPNVVGEGMACEVPVIATNVGDTAMLVNAPAQIIPPRNVNKLILALERLLTLSPQERKAIGQESREQILNFYSLSAMRKRYVSFYKSLR
jgi:glycosyltransferase involved in cell wall biosynthesis